MAALKITSGLVATRRLSHREAATGLAERQFQIYMRRSCLKPQDTRTLEVGENATHEIPYLCAFSSDSTAPEEVSKTIIAGSSPFSPTARSLPSTENVQHDTALDARKKRTCRLRLGLYTTTRRPARYASSPLFAETQVPALSVLVVPITRSSVSLEEDGAKCPLDEVLAALKDGGAILWGSRADSCLGASFSTTQTLKRLDRPRLLPYFNLTLYWPRQRPTSKVNTIFQSLTARIPACLAYQDDQADTWSRR